MANVINVAGLVTIKVDVNQGAGIETLGYSVNGVDITEEPFWLDIPGDEKGGDQGPPIDIQYLGEVHRIRCEMSKYDISVANKLRGRLMTNSASPGVPDTSGSLFLGTANNSVRVILDAATASFDRNYLTALPRQPFEVNRGTRYSTLIVEFEAHTKIPGATLWNTTTT